MLSIGILGGAFDPIHHGHLRLACLARDELELDVVSLLPTGTPTHRHPPVASPPFRRKMLKQAIENEPRLQIDFREMNRTAPSYMVDTLADTRKANPHAALSLILGLDTFALLDTWHQWPRLLTLAHLIVARRPGEVIPSSGPIGGLFVRHCTHLRTRIKNELSGAIFLLNIPLLEISSSHIRALLHAGRSVRYLVPDAVHQLIRNEKLYQNG